MPHPAIPSLPRTWIHSLPTRYRSVLSIEVIAPYIREMGGQKDKKKGFWKSLGKTFGSSKNSRDANSPQQPQKDEPVRQPLPSTSQATNVTPPQPRQEATPTGVVPTTATAITSPEDGRRTTIIGPLPPTQDTNGKASTPQTAAGDTAAGNQTQSDPVDNTGDQDTDGILPFSQELGGLKTAEEASTVDSRSLSQLKKAVIEFEKHYLEFAEKNPEYIKIDGDVERAIQKAKTKEDIKGSAAVFGKEITNLMNIMEEKKRLSAEKWTGRVGGFLTKLFPVAKLSLDLVGAAAEGANFMPLKGAAGGLGIILQIFDEENSRPDEFYSYLKRIEYQTVRLVGNPNFDLNEKSTRDRMHEKSLDLMTAIVNYFNSTLLYLRHDFFVNVLKRLGTGSEVYDSAKKALEIAISEYDQAVFDLTVYVVTSMKSQLDLTQKQKQDEEFLKWLSPSQSLVEGQLISFREQRGENTLQWASLMPEFQNWRKSNTQVDSKERILWIRGSLGVGKSILAGYFIDLLKCHHTDAIVAYFFCRSGQKGLTRAHEIVRTLAYQCILADEAARSVLEKSRAKDFKIEDLVGLNYLVQILLKEPLEQTQKEVFFVIDGLDEADLEANDAAERISRSEVEVLLKRLACLQNLRLLIISRPLQVVNKAIPDITTRQVGQEENRDDIDTYVRQYVDRHSKLKNRFDREKINPVDYFHEKANGVFLWVVLVLEQLEKARSISLFHEQIVNFSAASGDLETLYSAILLKFDVEAQKWLKMILIWLVVAAKVMELELLKQATEHSLGDELFEFEEFVEVDCGSILQLLAPESDSPGGKRVQFVHETFRTFLTNSKSCPLEFCINEAQAHSHVLDVCINSLSTKSDGTMLNKYAGNYWHQHLAKATLLSICGVRKFIQSRAWKWWIGGHVDFSFSVMAVGGVTPMEVKSRLRDIHSSFKELVDSCISREAQDNGDVEWALNIVRNSQILEEYFSKAATALWLYEDLPSKIAHRLFIFSLKIYCRGKGQRRDDLKFITINRFSDFVKWSEGQPDRDLNRRNLGIACFALYEWRESIMYLVDQSKSNDDVTMALGLAYLETGKYDKAIEMFNSIDDENIYRLGFIAVAHSAKDEVDKAIEWFERATADGESPMFLTLLGRLYSTRGDFDGEIRTYERAVASIGKWWSWQLLSAGYIAKGDIENYLDIFLRAKSKSIEWALTGLRRMQYVRDREQISGTQHSNFSISPINIVEIEGSVEEVNGAKTDSNEGASMLSQDSFHSHFQKSMQKLKSAVSRGSTSFRERIIHYPSGPWSIYDRDNWFAISNANAQYCFKVSLRYTWRHINELYCVAFSKNGEWLAAGSCGFVQVIDVMNFTNIATLADHGSEIEKGDILAVCFSPDGRYLVTGSKGHSISIWDIKGKVIIKRLLEHEDVVMCLAFSFSGKYLVSGSLDRKVAVWEWGLWNDTNTSISPVLLRKIEYTAPVLSLAFSPDDKLIGVTGTDGTICILNVADLTRYGDFKGHSYWVTSIAFSPNGNSLVSSSEDGTVRLWELESREGDFAKATCKKSLEAQTDWVLSTAWSSDGKWFISANSRGHVQLWEESGEIQFILFAHDEAGTSSLNLPIGTATDKYVSRTTLAHSPTAGIFATACYDGTARLWQYESTPNHADE